MTTYVGFWPRAYGLETPGHPWGARGVVSGLRIEALSSYEAAALLRWEHLTRFTSDMAYFYHLVHLNGVLVAVALDATQAVLGGLRDGKPYSAGVLPASEVEHDLWMAALSLFWTPELGDRVRLYWDAVDTETYPDFERCRLKWDNGLETGNPNVWLADLIGARNTNYVTAELAEDTTYTFARSQLDRVGNESGVGAYLAKTIKQPPLEPDAVAAVYDQTTRKVTITFEHPAGQHADCVGYAIYANEMPGWGALLDGLCAETYMRLRLLEPQNGSWTSGRLYAGDWLFAVKGVDAGGLESAYTPIRLSLVIDGPDLVEQPVRPVAPTWIEARSLAGGTIKVTAYHDGTDATHVRIYQDGVQIYDTAVVVGATSYAHTTGALVDAQEYSFTARARNSATLSAECAEALAVADSSAPGGSNALSAELVF